MHVEQTKFGKWNQAYRIIEGEAEMIVVTEIGPRILSLRVGGGENLLFVDTQNLARGDWKIYGGHRVWHGPETEGCYAPDNTPCMVTVLPHEFIVEAPVDPLSKLQKVLIIAGGNGRFRVRNIIRNTGTVLAPCVVWALTCVRPDAVVFFPWSRPGSWRMNTISFWKSWCGGEHGSDISSTQWKMKDHLFVIEPTGEEGKVGTRGYEGWIGGMFPSANATFLKKFEFQEHARYGDEGNAIQCYTCKHFIEMETLSPETMLYPGECVSHEETWILKRGLADLSGPMSVE